MLALASLLASLSRQLLLAGIPGLTRSSEPRCKFIYVVSTPLLLFRLFAYAGRVAPRSGLAVKNGIDTGAGVIDADYRGNVGVVLFNHDKEDFAVKAGDRVAQLILEQIATPEILEVDDLDDTTRGAGGYGSTGTA
jgi:deoxyuridine 5'-triphosphate nucleotidohydrolase